jgi:hypothetical protein
MVRLPALYRLPLDVPIGRQPVTYNGYDTSSPKISYCSGPRDAEFDPCPIYQSHVAASHVACICCVF